jgi:hypothetical protein
MTEEDLDHSMLFLFRQRPGAPPEARANGWNDNVGPSFNSRFDATVMYPSDL